MKYNAFLTTITSGQAQIPVGTKSWYVSAVSGNVWLDGIRLLTSTQIDGGGYDGRTNLETAINVGTTGGYALVKWDA